MLPSSRQVNRLMKRTGVADSARFWITLTVENMSSKEISKPIHVSPGVEQQQSGCLCQQSYILGRRLMFVKTGCDSFVQQMPLCRDKSYQGENFAISLDAGKLAGLDKKLSRSLDQDVHLGSSPLELSKSPVGPLAESSRCPSPPHADL